MADNFNHPNKPMHIFEMISNVQMLCHVMEPINKNKEEILRF